MKRLLKFVAGIVVALAVLAAAAIFLGLQLADRKMNRKVPVTVAAVDVAPTSATSLERGKYLFNSRGCAECHGDNGVGKVFVEKGESLRLKAPNITVGQGGVVAAYKVEDWVRSIRHGVTPSGRPLMIMPSEDFNRLTDTDVSALIAYAKSLPPAAGSGAQITLPLPARVMYGFGLIHDAAGKIDHTLPPAQPVAEGVNAQHGQYVANTCLGCHGAQFTGGRIPGGPPDWPPAANLRAGVMSDRYANADAFMAMLRSGKRPDGSAIKVMPFVSLGRMNETDMRALHLYLKGLAPVVSAGK
ncbi:MAG TPA: cytochrome c [Ramlibacter sp.]|nr:cytochrome c [Ramlibacter sp.]